MTPNCLASLRPVAGVLLAAALSASTGTLAAQDQTLVVHGGGSTFAAPIFKSWIEAYRTVAPAIEIGYDVIGSGEGVSRFLSGSLDFAATDAPLTDNQMAQVEGGVIHVPVTAGMIAVAYNLPGNLTGELRLPRDVLGDIFAGKITSWDDPRIAKANPGLKLPSQTLYIVARQDSSGTTYAFANHLNVSSETWRTAELGVGKLVAWPRTAILGRGNEGIAANILRGDGTIGYVTSGIADDVGLPVAALENAAGNFVAPSAESGAAAIATAVIPDDLRIDLPDPLGADAYPIVTFTWSLLRAKPADANKAEAIRAFTHWAISEGQGLAPKLGYVPLPQVVRDRAENALAVVTN